MLVMIGKSRYIEKLKIIRMRVAIISILWCLGSSLVAQQAWWNADQSYYHIPITEAGVYRLSQEVLLETDIPWEDIEPGAWELWREGQRIPVFVDDEGDRMYLEFAAHEPDAGVDSLLMSGRAEELLNPGYSMFSDTAHYYLSWSETGSNIGQTVYPVLPPLDASQRNSYVRTDTRIFSEQWVKPYSKIGGANIFLSEFQAGEGFASERTHSFEGTVSAVNPEPGSPGQLSLRFIGDFGQHDFAFSINGEERWQEDRGSFILENVAVNVDAEDLQNPIQYTLEGRIDNRDRFYVAEQQLIYHSQLRGEAMEGQGALDTGRVVLDWQGGLADSTVYYDLTNEIRYVFSPEGASWLSESPGPHEFLYAQKSAIRQLPAPARVESNLGTAYLDADYVILTSKRLAGGADNRAIQEYADFFFFKQKTAYEILRSDWSSDVCSSDLLQQLDGDVVRGAHEGHATVAGRAVDGDAGVHELAAGVVDVLHLVGDVAEVAALAVFLRIPVEGELERAFLVAGRRDEHQREAALFAVVAPDLAHAELVAVEVQRLVEIADAYHGVQVFHRHPGGHL